MRSLLLILIIFISSVITVAEEVILVLPFENTSQDSEYNWMGEGFALVLANILVEAGLNVIDRQERDLAYEKLGLQPSVLLTRAAALKVASKAGADLLVVGSYSIEGATGSQIVSVSARIIDVKRMHMSSELNFAGSVSKLQWIQGQLASEILRRFNPSLDSDSFIAQISAIPLPAFESYTKALLSANHEDKVRFLFKAITEYQKQTSGQYTQAVFELARLYYADKKWREALVWFGKLPGDSTHYLESRFYSGVCALQLSSAEAAMYLRQLLPLLPVCEVYNNLALAELRQGNLEEAIRLLGLAVQMQPDSDTLFNYGYALWRAGQYQAAANQFNKLVRINPNDGQALYFLAKSLQKIDQHLEATAALDGAKKYLPDFAKWEVGKISVSVDRIKECFARSTFLRLKKVVATRGQQRMEADTKAAASNVKLRRATELFQAGRDTEALEQLVAHLRDFPDDAEAHLLVGRIRERRGQIEAAINSLKVAVFWNPKLVPAHLLLGKLYLQQNKREEAELCLHTALQLEPENPEVLAFSQMLQRR
ncbi:MAG: tetratricopeptide repeat protein [Acidobacteriota bacterium]|nr:tetratricopeptide repeat protein [Blastocatellia bacterium]MDW8412559.1 tetratricopeptide repeat protein [Acidobacteriota bacterium]